MAFPYVKIGPWANGSAPALSAANMTLLDDGIYDAQFPASVKVRHSANQSLTDLTYASLTFDTEVWDTHAMHLTGTNPERLTSVASGKYIVTAQADFASNATGFRELLFRVNGTAIHGRAQAAAVNGVGTSVSLSDLIHLGAGDYVEVRARQNSGGALNVVATSPQSPLFSAVRVA